MIKIFTLKSLGHVPLTRIKEERKCSPEPITKKLLRKSRCLMLISILCLQLSHVFAQQSAVKGPSVRLTGTVRDVNGQPLSGVTIKALKTSAAVATNTKGQYDITVPSLPVTLSFSAISLKPIQKVVTNDAPLTVVMEDAQSNLNEVVVIGYGTAKKSDLTGSVGSVSTKNVDESAYDNFQQALAGKVAGVVVSQSSGAPGAGLNVEIRGQNSLSYGTNPLYVLDGIPLESPNVSGLNTNGNAPGAFGSSPLATINPNDIASIEILKDASATAIYGSRGANGVVLITTKKGKAGATRISANVSNGYSRLQKTLRVLNSTEYANYVNEAATNRNALLPFAANDIDGLPNYNHQADITQLAKTLDANLSLSGGDAKSNYYVSGQYYSQDGIIISTGLSRYNFKTNYQNQISDRLKFTTSINYTKTVANGNIVNSGSGGFLNSALLWAPTSPFYNPDGTVNLLNNYYYGNTYYNDPTLGSIYYNPRFTAAQAVAAYNPGINNPISYLNGVTNANTSTQVLANFQLDYKISNDFAFNALFGYTTYNSLLENYIPITAPVPSSGLKGIATVGDLESTKLLYQASLTYNKRINKHNINAVIVGTYEDYEEKAQTASTQSFTTDATGIYSIQGGTVLQTPTTNFSNFGLISTIFRTSYNYDARYYLTLSGRYDGSSKFADGNQFGFFPSIGVSWRVANEKWFKNQTILNEFKLRASYGIIGNQAVGPYSTLNTLSSANVAFGGVVNAGYYPSRLPNTSLKWEQARQTDAGVDIGLFKDRIDITADIYDRTTPNLIYNITLPGSTGFSTIPKNIGSIQNRGLELSLTTVNIRSKAVTWSTNFNIAFNQNKVLQLTGTAGEYIGVNALIGTAYLTRVQPGHPIGEFYGLINLPVWNDETILTKPAAFQQGAKAGDLRYQDVNGDGALTDADRVYLGSALPKFAGGFGTSVSYKHFDLSAQFTYQYGNKVFNQIKWNLGSEYGTSNTLLDVYSRRYISITANTDPSQIDAIKANNAITTIPRAGTTYDDREVSTNYLEDGSFIRCRDIVLNYNFSTAIAKKLSINNLSLFFNLQNAFVLTHYSGYNPEVNTGSGLTRGLDNGSNPLAKTYRIGIKVGL